MTFSSCGKFVLGFLLLFSTSRIASASEGGASLYLQGTYNDFGLATVPTPGVYSRSDVFLNASSVGRRALGGRVDVGIDQNAWIYAAKLGLVFDAKIFGATPSIALALPVILRADVTGSVATAEQEGFRTGYVGGLGDIYVVPFDLTWVFGDHNLSLGPGVYIPTGAYDMDRALNAGRNYWGFDPGGSYTWLSSELGFEFSLAAGYLINLKNPATNYRTGHELHLDYLIAQHLDGGFGFGVTGYVYQQMTSDDGTLPGNVSPSDFKANSTGIGPAAMVTPQPFGKDVVIIAKWLHDIHASHRFKGDLVMLSIALQAL